MAGLADSASLGYGIGLGAEYKDKTNLVNQLEQNRLKRAQLEQPKEEKEVPLKDFTKAITIDSKWHRILVPKVIEYSNEAAQKADALRNAQNGKITISQLNNISAELSQKLAPLETSNKNFNDIEKKSLDMDWLKQNALTKEDNQLLTFLHTGKLEDQQKSGNPIFETDLGTFKINAETGTFDNPLPIEKDKEQDLLTDAISIAKQQRLGLYKDRNTGGVLVQTGMPKTIAEAQQLESETGNKFVSVEEVQQNFFAQNPNQIRALKDKNKDQLIDLKNQLIQANQIPNTVSNKDFLNDPKYNGVVNNYLLDQQYKKINNQAVDISQKPFKTSDFLKNIANDITQEKTMDQFGNQIISEKKIDQQQAIDNFTNLLNTSEMKQAIYDLGTDESGKNFDRQKGIDKAFDIYKNDLIKNQKSLSVLNEFKPLTGSGGGTLWSGSKQFTIQPIEQTNTYIDANELDAIKYAMQGKNEKGEALLAYIDSETSNPYFSVSPKNPKDKLAPLGETPAVPKTIYEGWNVLKQFGHKERAAPKDSYIISAASVAKDERTKLSDFNLKADNNKEYASHITGFVTDAKGNITHVAAIPAGQDISQGAKEILFPYKKNVDAVSGYTSGGGNLEDVIKKLYEGNNNIVGNKKGQIKSSNVPKVQKKEEGGLVTERMFILGNKAFKESKLKDAGYDINTLEEYK